MDKKPFLPTDGKKLKTSQRRIVQRFFRRLATVPDSDPAARDLDSVLRVILNGLRINSVFFPQNPFGKGLGGILIINWNNGLDDDRPENLTP
jgi:hypothetical protein